MNKSKFFLYLPDNNRYIYAKGSKLTLSNYASKFKIQTDEKKLKLNQDINIYAKNSNIKSLRLSISEKDNASGLELNSQNDAWKLIPLKDNGSKHVEHDRSYALYHTRSKKYLCARKGKLILHNVPSVVVLKNIDSANNILWIIGILLLCFFAVMILYVIV